MPLGLVTEEIQQCFWRGMYIYFLHLSYFLHRDLNTRNNSGQNLRPDETLKYNIH